MRRAALFLTLFIAVGSGAAEIRTPETWGLLPCRLDSAVPARVKAAAEAVWKVGAKGRADQSRRIVINPRSAGPDVIPLFIVKDSLAVEDPCAPRAPGLGEGEMREFDEHTVAGICRADNGAVICSADAVREIVKMEDFVSEKNGGALPRGTSPAIAYLFAHEFAHVRLGHPGAFTEGVVSIDLAMKREAKIAELVNNCHISQPQVKREEEADQEAFVAVRKLFTAPPYRVAGADEITLVMHYSEAVYMVSEILTTWGALYYGAPERESLFPGKKELCSFMNAGRGKVVLPVFGGSHPHAWTRLAGITNSVGKYVNELRVQQKHDPDRGEFAVLGMNRVTDTMRAKGFDAASKRFCRYVDALENGTLDCANPGEEEPLEVDFSDPRDEEAVLMPIEFTPAGPYREVPDDRAVAILYEFGSIDRSPSRDVALGEAKRMSEAYGAFLRDIDRHLRERGGYWLSEKRGQVSVKFSSFGEEYFATVEDVTGFARAGGSLKIGSLPNWKALERWGSVDEFDVLPWNEAIAHLWLSFARSADDKEHAFVIVTRNVPLRRVFGPSNGQLRPAPLIADLLRFLRKRLEQTHGGTFVLHRGSSITVHGRENHGYDVDVPSEWSVLAASNDPVATPAADLLALIDRTQSPRKVLPRAQVLGEP